MIEGSKWRHLNGEELCFMKRPDAEDGESVRRA
jgi:hypothetical protein